ncbi:MAG: polymer-forming cytoskeletal protein [Hyphomicrobium sp.]|jgi:cytoskeletal protein CcmA (bactofilin family)
MVFQRKHDPKTLTVVPAEVTTLPTTAAGGRLDAASVIGKDMSIEGQAITVRCKGALRVNGAITADLHCNELVVGEEAIVNGSIAADTVRVFGRVQGAILGANVTLHPSAQVDGDIHAQSLTIEQGASFDGRSRKVANAAEVAPQLETQTMQHRAYG